MLLGGPGNDHLWGGCGHDAVAGGGGGPRNDRIDVLDSARDRVRCGSGTDVVFADGVDRVASSCERVVR